LYNVGCNVAKWSNQIDTHSRLRLPRLHGVAPEAGELAREVYAMGPTSPGLKDVARRAGVSVKTVSNVINAYPHVSPGTRSKVQAAIEEIGYRPHQGARLLRTGRSGLVALSVPEMTPYFAEIAELVMNEAEARGWTVLMDRTHGERRHERWAAGGISRDLIDGLIASPLSMTPTDLASARSVLPVVLLGERLSNVGADHVAIDNVRAAREATAHLLAGGRTRVAAIGAQSKPNGTSVQRLEGYRAALAEAGIAYDEELVRSAYEYHLADGHAAMQQLLALPEPPEGVLCFNDLLALGAMRAVHSAGGTVPGDVAVVGVDDIEECAYAEPTLSSVRPDKAFIARTAVSLLAERIAGDPERHPQDVVAPHELRVRASSS
jgi:DNA-binding LacI/PurR family transcriptional regulator